MIFLQNGILGQFAASSPSDANPEDCCAVIVSGGNQPWILRIYAKLNTQKVYLGAVRLFNLQKTRVGAIVSCPGAQSFEVEGEASSTTADTLGIDFVGTQARGGPWGVSPVPGISVDGARSYRVLTGISGVVTVVGEVLGWAARTAQAGGTVAWVAPPSLVQPAIGVPQNGEVNGNADGLLAPESTWTFTNTDGYIIEYVPPGAFPFDG
jgi:hypothetical protein